jgi:isoleucyl-tRNA synthetase
VRSVDESAPESVHLSAWPEADAAAVDEGVAFHMAAARRVVEMGRAARNAAAVKTRQPLAEVIVALPEAERDAVLGLRDVVLDELNVKELRVAADGGELVSYTVKPNLPVLGPKLGKQVGAVQAALREADGAALVASLEADGSIELTLPDGSTLPLDRAELLVETGSPAGYEVVEEAGRTVALHTEIDEALREEGVARELVHAVQLARKNADLRIEDTIRLALALPEELRPVGERFSQTIASETLAGELVFDGAEGEHVESARVEGLEVQIGLTVTGTIFSAPH